MRCRRDDSEVKGQGGLRLSLGCEWCAIRVAAILGMVEECFISIMGSWTADSLYHISQRGWLAGNMITTAPGIQSRARSLMAPRPSDPVRCQDLPSLP